LASKDGTFGFLVDPMDAIGLFDVFHAGWFAMLMGTTVASTGAYIVSRFPGIWTAITHPRKRVPDRYFEMAPNRFVTTEALDVDRLESGLRRQRYRVERYQEDGGTYLFADRLASAQLGTLLTHAAVIIFVLSAVVSRMDAFESGLFLAEGSTLPVFPVRNPEQIQVQLTDARAAFAPDGQALEYRSEMVISRTARVKRCFSTVNSPCSYEGYRFYQAAYFGFGAAVQVRDLATGNVVYQETLALVDRAPSPRVLIQDAGGRTLLEEKLVLTDELDTGDVLYRGTLVTLPDGRLLTMGLQERRQATPCCLRAAQGPMQWAGAGSGRRERVRRTEDNVREGEHDPGGARPGPAGTAGRRRLTGRALPATEQRCVRHEQHFGRNVGDCVAHG
jgi:hypothetical protein